MGPGLAGVLLVVQWSATLVALLTLNSLAAPELALALEFIPVLAPAESVPFADALAVAWSPVPFPAPAAEFEPLVAAPS